MMGRRTAAAVTLITIIIVAGGLVYYYTSAGLNGRTDSNVRIAYENLRLPSVHSNMSFFVVVNNSGTIPIKSATLSVNGSPAISLPITPLPLRPSEGWNGSVRVVFSSPVSFGLSFEGVVPQLSAVFQITYANGVTRTILINKINSTVYN